MALRNAEFAGRFAFPDQVPRSRRCSAFAILGGAMNREDSAPGGPLNSSRGDLERALGLKEAVALNMIEMVGIGPFVVIPLVIKAMGGPQCLLAWAAGAVLALLDGFEWSELGAAMPLAGGSYVFLREAYGPGRMGRPISFLFVSQTLIQAPLSLASGAVGFSQYASYLYPLGTYGQKAVSGALVILLVILLYRRISSIGKISLFLWVGVVGTILWLIWGGVTHFQPRLVFTYAPGSWDFSWLFFATLGSATVNTIYTYWGYYNICHLGGEIRRDGQHHLHLLGLLQHLPSRRRNPRSCPQYSARHFYFHYRHRHFVSGHADQHPWRASMAAGARLALHRQRLRGKALRLGCGAFRHRHGSMDCFCFRVLFPARILPRPLLRCAGWKFFSHLRSRASRKEISAYLASFSGRPFVSLFLALQAQNRNCRRPGYAPDHSVHRSGRRSNAVTTPLVSGASAV